MNGRRPRGSEERGYAPARAHEAVTLEFDGETLVYQRHTGGVHRLDSVGSIVWHLLDGQTTVDELVTDLAAAFEADPDVVRSDLERLVERLRKAFLLADGPEVEQHTEPLRLTNPPSP